MQCKLDGKFSFFKKIDGIEIPFFNNPSQNKILDVWLARANTGTLSDGLSANAGANIVASHCRIGTGNAATTGGMTDLAGTNLGGVSALTGSGTLDISHDGGNNKIVIKFRRRFEFDIGAIVGNATEVAIYNNTSTLNSTTIMSRALITDGNGDPTTLTLTSQDQLVIYWDLELQVPATFEVAKTIKSNSTTVKLSLHMDPAAFSSSSAAWDCVPWKFYPGKTLSATWQYIQGASNTEVVPAYNNTSFSGFTSESAAGNYLLTRPPVGADASGIRSRIRAVSGVLNDAAGFSKIKLPKTGDIHYLISFNNAPYPVKTNTEIFEIELFTKMSSV